jgi:hypothetical protein
MVSFHSVFNTLDGRCAMGLYNGGLKNDDDNSKLRPTDARQPSLAGNPLQQGNTSMMQRELSSQLFNYCVQEQAARAAIAKAISSNISPSSPNKPNVVVAQNRRHTRSSSRARRVTPFPARFHEAGIAAKARGICDAVDYSCWRELEEHVQKQLQKSYCLRGADTGIVRIAEIHILQQTTADDDYPVPQLKSDTFATWVHPPADHEK